VTIDTCWLNVTGQIFSHCLILAKCIIHQGGNIGTIIRYVSYEVALVRHKVRIVRK